MKLPIDTERNASVRSDAQEGTTLDAHPAGRAAGVDMIGDTKLSRVETVSVPDAVETNTTDETYVVGNREFLTAVFGDVREDARPLMVSFVGNPASAPVHATPSVRGSRGRGCGRESAASLGS